MCENLPRLVVRKLDTDYWAHSSFQVNVSVKSDKDDAYDVKEFMRKSAPEIVRTQLAIYIKKLKEGEALVLICKPYMYLFRSRQITC